MRNIKLLLAYDGTEFHGWERQKAPRTIQQTVEEAISDLSDENVRLRASGRTDTGVHALGQVANFHTRCVHAPQTWVRALNARLPDDVVVLAAQEAPCVFDANHDVITKRYRYLIADTPVVDPFSRRYVFHSKAPLDARAMHRAGQCLCGTHDFHSFETQWPNRTSSVRTITSVAAGRAPTWALWQPRALGENPLISRTPEAGNSRPGFSDQASNPVGPESPFLYIEVEADGFLYNMVRAIAGTLINVGRGYWPEAKVQEILRAEDRRAAGPTAPAHGLFLVCVHYPSAGDGT